MTNANEAGTLKEQIGTWLRQTEGITENWLATNASNRVMGEHPIKEVYLPLAALGHLFRAVLSTKNLVQQLKVDDADGQKQKNLNASAEMARAVQEQHSKLHFV